MIRAVCDLSLLEINHELYPFKELYGDLMIILSLYVYYFLILASLINGICDINGKDIEVHK